MVNAGYLVGTAIFLSALIVLVIIQFVAKKFYPLLYWATLMASHDSRAHVSMKQRGGMA